MRAKPPKPERENTIALINIVFLMLIFFLVAGTLAQPIDSALKLVNTSDIESTSPPADALVVHPDGRMSLAGQDIATPEAFLETRGEEGLAVVRLIPDRELPAEDLVALARALRGGGAERVVIVSERGLE
ncbi:ExbD/TolR family protein [Salipiger thiooxidans]|uniref:ExbD/TolR family protein n=1 Tax=Salipiger thiooxidans TaxID=282683 RepID=UPI001CD7BF60|nr:biopolymer transporter ExbD [Salipiger thiooxidans]MCA0849066.1 biopolymer transporter ExbD [Salipiger thiooxidans]